MKNFLPDEYTYVLEVGCGTGNFSSGLDSSAEKWGIEMQKDAAEIAKARLFKVIHGDYDSVENLLPDNYFDLIICNDVIEHMPDHDDFLDKVKNKLKIGGYVVSSIPNVRYYKNLYELLFLKDWKYRNGGILDNTHLRFFTEKSITDCIKRHGYEINQMSGINSAIESTIFYKKWIKSIFFSLIYLFSLGNFKDIKYLQFGLRFKKLK